MRKTVPALLWLLGMQAAFGATANPGTPNLGKPAGPADMRRWDIDIGRDGRWLPPGEGTAAQGAPIFAGKCAACHGDGGRGTDLSRKGLPAPPVLVSDMKRKGIDGSTTTIANFWPYAPPLFGYIRAAMPWNEPRSLTDHEVYALTAFILAENKLIDAKQVMNAQTLAKVMMPNRNGFLVRFPEITPR
ncbi:MAG: cytochrome c [Acidobacteria bacterium]|nr:cytochrome c [Acidobacteriota bacterium]